ncbi:MAG: hypothetical protein NWQ43_04495 [Dolichospermum sp.]|nr:hypothetical protein [Dolichospermum sp.]
MIPFFRQFLLLGIKKGDSYGALRYRIALNFSRNKNMNNIEKAPASTERVTMLITILTIATQAGLYLLTGGFAAGGKLNGIESEIKLIRQEVVSANQIQDYRLDKLEGKSK